MSFTTITIALLLLLFFLILNPANKTIISLIVSSSVFDLAPKVVFGKDIWDFGLLLFFITAIHLLFSKKQRSITKPGYLYLMYVFIAWMFMSLIWSILIFDYDIGQTLKNARHMVLGYFLIFIFIRLYEVNDRYFKLLAKYLYIATYILMIVLVIQYVIKKPILYGLAIDYQGSLRVIPVFLPFIMLITWKILFGYISGVSIKFHEKMFITLSFFSIATTYTRGIYLAFILGFLGMFAIAIKQRKMSGKRAVLFIGTGLLSFSILLMSGSIDKVVNRAASAASILTGVKKQTAGGADTFSGRLMLAVERFDIVIEHNPLVGYGFLHEDEVPNAMRNKLKYGSIIYSDYYKALYRRGHPYMLALYSADIGWADMVLKTGIIGLSVFLIMLFFIIISITKITNTVDEETYRWRVAFYLQLVITILLMFNGNPFIVNVQIPMYLIAGLIYCSQPNIKITNKP
jgi:hypothetical protein